MNTEKLNEKKRQAGDLFRTASKRLFDGLLILAAIVGTAWLGVHVLGFLSWAINHPQVLVAPAVTLLAAMTIYGGFQKVSEIVENEPPHLWPIIKVLLCGAIIVTAAIATFVIWSWCLSSASLG